MSSLINYFFDKLNLNTEYDYGYTYEYDEEKCDYELVKRVESLGNRIRNSYQKYFSPEFRKPRSYSNLNSSEAIYVR